MATKILTPDGMAQLLAQRDLLRIEAKAAHAQGRMMDYQTIVEKGKRLNDLMEPAESAKRLQDCSCKACLSDRIFEVVGTWPGNHYSKIVCGECGAFQKWGSKPRLEKQKRSTKGHSKILAKQGQGYCQMCLRSQRDLDIRHGLEVHHVVEVADGGTDEPSNIWILCKHCHAQVHLMRNYLACKALNRNGNKKAS